MLNRVAVIVALAVLSLACTTTPEPIPEYRLKQAAEYNAELGSAYLAQGNLEQAKLKFEKALTQDEDNANAHSGYALLNARLGDNKLADEHFQKALALDPDNSEVLNNYGAYLCDNGRRVEAEKYFMQAARNPLYKTPEFAFRNAGICALRMNDLYNAEIYFKEALGENPRFGPAIVGMVRVNQQQQRYQAAVAYLDRYHQYYPQSPQSLLLAVRLYEDIGNQPLADDYARRLRELFPDSPQTQQLDQVQ